MVKAKIGFFYLFVLIIFHSCEEIPSPTTCEVPEPEKNIEWLRSVIEEAEAGRDLTGKITLYSYQNKEVFLQEVSLNIADGIDYVRGCEGDTLCEFGGLLGLNTCPDFTENAKELRVLWEE